MLRDTVEFIFDSETQRDILFAILKKKKAFYRVELKGRRGYTEDCEEPLFCGTCNSVKPSGEFSNDKSSPNGKRRRCRACDKIDRISKRTQREAELRHEIIKGYEECRRVALPEDLKLQS